MGGTSPISQTCFDNVDQDNVPEMLKWGVQQYSAHQDDQNARHFSWDFEPDFGHAANVLFGQQTLKIMRFPHTFGTYSGFGHGVVAPYEGGCSD